jgi:glucose uptake protein GlcU
MTLMVAMSDDDTANNQLLGWLAIFGAWLAFGSFAVPMKWQSVVDAQVHPLVYQCYKTFWTFVTSHLVLCFQPYRFSVWGIASGFSWVPAGVAAVVAVQNCGIACGQAVWQVGIIMTSLAWTFLVLHDAHIRNWWGTVLSVLALLVGVVGMTLTFNLKKPEQASSLVASLNDSEIEEGQPEVAKEDASKHEIAVTDKTTGIQTTRSAIMASTGSRISITKMAETFASFGSAGTMGVARPRSRKSMSDVRFGMHDLKESASNQPGPSMALGIGAAVFNGVWGGSNLVPSHYAPYHGIEFTISFATGAAIANVALVLVYICLAKLVWKSPLPSPQFRVMMLPGFLSGTLWSIGNFCSLAAVAAMGQGIGNALIQSSVIVSGLWGILWYREMTGLPVLFWSGWMFVCVAGIVGLAIEEN